MTDVAIDDDLREGLIWQALARAAGTAVDPTTPKSWSEPAWFIDAIDGSDNNAGTTADTPLRSLMGLAAKWSTYSPTLNQVTTLTVLSDLTPTDIWRFDPYLTENGALKVQGAFKQSASATIGVFTPPNYVAGTLGTVTALGQSGNYWAPFVGKYVKDTTAGAYFYIVADLGGATASINQPMIPLSTGTYATIANSDALSIGSWTTITGSTLVYGGSFALGGLTFQQITLDTADSDEIRPGICTFYEVAFAKSVAGPIGDIPPFFYGCLFEDFFACGGNFWGGLLAGPPGSVIAGNVLDGDLVIAKRFHIQPGTTSLAHVYMGEGLVNRDIGPGQFTIIRANYPTIVPRIWGPGAFQLFGTSQVSLIGETWASTMLLTGGLRLNGGTIGYPWVAGSHAYGAAVNLTPANLDANGNLWDPSTGAGFYSQI